ncbi:hypothetical protein [Tepidibacter hydrothermalis]|uniref:Uncharacterized protein n=1 Tax=Tepidibacter hydrothermalis TaxID=3036126 RepID=A0ABY8EIR7_9FIRM|nr:hypothetical protein [Tepidibacter hydrothermalis]WFD10753.1 hypothetical protein P4S50_01370 [Tepidibacter hydrothermalis]
MNENKKIIIKLLNGIMQNQNINTTLTNRDLQLVDKTNGTNMSVSEVKQSIEISLKDLEYIDEEKEIIIKVLNGIMQNQNINTILTGSNIELEDKINGINVNIFEVMEYIQMNLKDLD